MYGKKTQVVLDGTFVLEFMPHADADAIKVYLLGLELCFAKDEQNNSLEQMSAILSMSVERIVSAFEYWQNLGLVQVIAREPLEVRYLPIESGSANLKKYKADKFHDFNVMVQSILSGREILPNEFNEYYYFLESRHFEPEAFISIVRYCTMLKGDKVRYPYVLAVARSFADDGILTQQAVEEKLIELEGASTELKAVLRALGLKRDPDPEERKLYLKWTKNFGFSNAVVLFVARASKGGGIAKLDSELLKFYQHKLFSIPEIESFSENQEKLFDLAKEITRAIGVFYQNLDKVIETYVTDWTQKGYDKETLLQIADYCFKKSIRTLEGMNNIVQKFFKLGLISLESIGQYTNDLASVDQKIGEVLSRCGLVRNVNSWDRDFYRTWTFSWNLSHGIILLAADKAKGKEQPMAYLNKLLASLHSAGISTESEAKKQLESSPVSTSAEKPANKMITRNYSEQELSALFDNLDDIEV